jgi:hypothetical protein
MSNYTKWDVVDVLRRRNEFMKPYSKEGEYEQIETALQILSENDDIGIHNHGVLVEPYYIVEIHHGDSSIAMKTAMIPICPVQDFDDIMKNAMKELKEGKVVEVPNEKIKYMFTAIKEVEDYYNGLTKHTPFDQLSTPKLRILPSLYCVDSTPIVKKSTNSGGE